MAKPEILVDGIIRINDILLRGVGELSTFIIDDMETPDIEGIKHNMNNAITQLNRDIAEITNINRDPKSSADIHLNRFIDEVINNISSCDDGSFEVIIGNYLTETKSTDDSTNITEFYDRTIRLLINQYKTRISENATWITQMAECQLE